MLFMNGCPPLVYGMGGVGSNSTYQTSQIFAEFLSCGYLNYFLRTGLSTINFLILGSNLVAMFHSRTICFVFVTGDYDHLLTVWC